MNDSSDKLPYWLNAAILTIAGAGLFAAFLYGLRSILGVPISYMALLILLWPYRSYAAVVSILRTVTVLFLIYVVWLIKPLFPTAIISILLVVVLRAPVNALCRRGIKRGIAAPFVLVSTISLLGIILAIILPAIFDQTEIFAKLLPVYYERIHTKLLEEWLPYLQSIPLLQQFDFELFKEKLPQLAQKALLQFANLGEILVKQTGNIVNQLLNLLLVPIVTLYLLLDSRTISQRLFAQLPEPTKSSWMAYGERVSEILSRWLRGQLLIAAFIGSATGIGLAIIGVNYALTIAVLTMLLAFVPYIGILLSLILAILLGLTGGGGLFVIVKIVVLYGIIQFLEGNFLTPRIMGKAVGMSDLMTMITLAIGAQLFGLFGLIFAVPVTAIGTILFREWWNAEFRKGSNVDRVE
ncbi:MAG: AI-2E family transporter [bacterium]|nr:AI-2E family transporter [bacterium]